MTIEKIIVEVAIPKGCATTMDELVQRIDDALCEATSNGISYEVYKEPAVIPPLAPLVPSDPGNIRWVC